MNRRDFVKLAGAALPAASAFGKINSKVNGVRLGVQSYSFRTLPLDEAIKGMVDIGIGECELTSLHVEPGFRPPAGAGGGAKKGEQKGEKKKSGGPNPAMREEQRKWRLSVSLDHFKDIKKKFDTAGVTLQAYNYSFNDSFSDEEIDRGFQFAQALGVKIITASSTVSCAKRVAPFADKYKIAVAMHGHSNIKDPNQFAKPESFEAAMAFSKYITINLDIGHFFAAGYDPVEYLTKQHARISNLHIKDRKKDQGDNTVWGEGDTPIKAVLQLLKTKKWNIPANIEYEYRGDDAVAEVRKCFQYCKTALA
ncbi:MAG: sugar phosphate isomerase/epimerase [Acidobacteria bacterium]|nr:sugar phosphate isomerase/epimerase [Acidobacteriota bacterium]